MHLLFHAISWRIIDRGLMDLYGILIAVQWRMYAYVSSCAHLN